MVSASGPYRLVRVPDRRDRYGRLGGKLLDAAGQSLNARRVANDYAIPLPDPGGTDPESAVLAEAQVLAASHGLWGAQSQAMGLWRGQAKP